jgi:hypothetical protein
VLQGVGCAGLRWAYRGLASDAAVQFVCGVYANLIDVRVVSTSAPEVHAIKVHRAAVDIVIDVVYHVVRLARCPESRRRRGHRRGRGRGEGGSRHRRPRSLLGGGNIRVGDIVLDALRDADGAEDGERVPCPLDRDALSSLRVGNPSDLPADGLVAFEEIEWCRLALELAAGNARQRGRRCNGP